ncbi:MAG: PhoD-like phosphatase N-terminal domain-containing protein, partial [Bacteroidota bacterium]
MHKLLLICLLATIASSTLFSQRLDDLFQSELAPFYHGVASGDPLEDAVIIWTRVTTDEPEV